MKRLIRLVSTLAVAGLALAYTGCTDYSEDVNRLDERIDGQIATTEEQYKKLQEADDKLQAAIDAANTSIKALQDNTASLQDELTALKTKHEADIKAVKEAHAADKTAIEKALADKAQELTTALGNLDTKYGNEIKKLNDAYTKADGELKSQIDQNVTKITALRTDVDNLSNVVIPEVKDQIKNLKETVEKDYATKVELTQETTKVVALVNEKTSALETRLADVEKRLGELSTAHETLKKSFEDTKADHEKRIKDLETTVATLGEDVADLKTKVAAAKTAADNAQKAADAAKTAADKAQATAEQAVADAAAAAKAAKAAQDDATKALGEISELKEILGDYATEKGKLTAAIDNIMEDIKALAAKDSTLSASKDSLFKAIDRLTSELTQKVADLTSADTELQNQINNIFSGEKFTQAFKDKFDTAFGGVDYKTAFDKLFNAAFGVDDEGNGIGYETAFTNLFNEAFKKAFVYKDEEGNDVNGDFATAFGALFNKAFSTAFDGEGYSKAFNDAIEKAVMASPDPENPEKQGAIFEAISKQIKTFKDGTFTPVQNSVDRINKTVQDIILVVGDLADRIQSVTFVPEYDDMCASLYYYYINTEKDGKTVQIPLSDKIVKAKFEVYPKSQAKKVAAMLNKNDGTASIVAVPLKSSWTRAASEVASGKTVATGDDEEYSNGIINVEVVFNDADVEYARKWDDAYIAKANNNEACGFAISLRVISPDRESTISGAAKYDENGEVVKDEDGNVVYEDKKLSGDSIESAYVNVVIADGCNLTGKFDIWCFKKDEKGNDVAVEPFDNVVDSTFAWSTPLDESKWNYYCGDPERSDARRYDARYAVKIADYRNGETYNDKTTYKTLEKAAEIMKIDVAKITPAMEVAETVLKGEKVVTKTHAKYFDTENAPKALANASIALSAEAAKDPKNAVGSVMRHETTFSLKDGDKVLVDNIITKRTAEYLIGRREVKFQIVPSNNLIKWTYKLACELSDPANGKFYNEDILTFNKENEVVRIDSEENVKISLGDLLKDDPTYYIVNNEQKPASYKPIEIEMVAEKVDEIAKVKILGGKYQFLNGKENRYDITAVYAVDDEYQTDYKVNFSYILGPMPNHVTVTLDKFAFDYAAGKDAVKTFTEKDVVTKTKAQMTAAEVNMFIDGKNDRLWESINQELFSNDETGTKRISGTTVTQVNGLSYITRLSVLPVGITVQAAYNDILTFGDQFTYKTVRKTWYGVNYTYQTDGSVNINKPIFKLTNSVRSEKVTDNPKVFHADILNQDITKRTDRYQLNKTINLSEYFDVTNTIKDEDGKVIKVEEYNNLEVVYNRLTEKNETKGIINVPEIETEVVNVNPSVSEYTYKIDPSYISWLNATSYENSVANWFTAQNYNVGLTLKYDGKELDTAELQLVTKDPIKEFKFDPNVILVSTGTKAANLWSKMNVFGVVDEDAQLIWHDAGTLQNSIDGWHSAPEQIINAKTYGCKVTFAPLKEVRVYVNGAPTNINDTKFKYNAADGIIEFTGDLADLKDNKVTFEIDAVLNHFLDFAGKQPKKATAVVTFQK